MWGFWSSFQYRSLISSPHTCIAGSSGKDRKTQEWRGKLGESKLSSRHMNWDHCNCCEIMPGTTHRWRNKTELVLQIWGKNLWLSRYWSGTNPNSVPSSIHQSSSFSNSNRKGSQVLFYLHFYTLVHFSIECKVGKYELQNVSISGCNIINTEVSLGTSWI